MIGSNSIVVAQDDVRVQEIQSLINELESVSSGGGVAMATRSQDLERFQKEYGEYSDGCHRVSRVLARQVLLSMVSKECSLPLVGTLPLVAVQWAVFTLSESGVVVRPRVESLAELFETSTSFDSLNY